MRYQIKLTGLTPLLMHQDNVSWQEKTKVWQKDPENKKFSVAGDDRTPAWTWIGALYHDGVHVCVPSDNVMTMMREGGAQIIVKGNKTFKAQTQSGIIPLDCDWVLHGEDGDPIPVQDILSLEGNMEFNEHVEICQCLGFDLLVKRARIGTSKHTRVRPIFRIWSIVGHVEVIDDQITEKILQSILEIGGTYKGLCDWRPSSRTPGRFGTFLPKIKKIK